MGKTRLKQKAWKHDISGYCSKVPWYVKKGKKDAEG
jgi:hypothetical protein